MEHRTALLNNKSGDKMKLELSEPRVKVRPALETAANSPFSPIDDIVGKIDGIAAEAERILREAIEAEQERIRAATPIGGYYFEFDSWETSNLHWVAPSALTIWPTGHMELTIRRLSNQYTLKPDRGGPFTWTFDVELFEKYEDAAPWWRRNYVVQTLGWKVERDNILKKYDDTGLADQMSKSGAASITRHRHTNPSPPGSVLPIYDGTF
jgi:hypothetical protein